MKIKLNWQRGEIATILTLISVVLMVAGIAAGTKIAQNNTEQRTQAAQTATVSGCSIVDTDQGPGCWCQQGDWQFHCFAGATRGTPPSALCVQNCTSCNGKTGEQCLAGTGGTPPAGNGTPPPGGSCTLASLIPDVGDCGSCILGKSPGTKDFITSNTGATGCLDNQIASFWCNGGVSEDGKNQCQNLKSQCLDQKLCTGKPIPTPTPTTAAGGGGGTPGPGGGGNTPTPDPNGTYGNYVIISTDSKIRRKTSIETGKNDYQLGISSGTYPVQYVPDAQNHVSEDKTYSSALTDNPTVFIDGFIYHPATEIIQELNGKIADTQLIGSALLSSSQDSINLEYKDQTLIFCFPYNKTYSKFDDVPKISKKDLLSKCKDRMNILDLPPEPPKDTTKSVLTFNIKFNNAVGNAQYHVILSSASCDKDNLTSCTYSSITITDQNNQNLRYTPSGYINMHNNYPNWFTVSVELPPNTTGVNINMIGDLYNGDNRIKKETTQVSCGLSGIPISLKSGGSTNELGDLILVTAQTDSCTIDKIAGSKDTFLGSANADFDKAMDKWKSGEIDATQMSAFISQLTRVPGLQTTFCDPVKGECNPVF